MDMDMIVNRKRNQQVVALASEGDKIKEKDGTMNRVLKIKVVSNNLEAIFLFDLNTHI